MTAPEGFSLVLDPKLRTAHFERMQLGRLSPLQVELLVLLAEKGPLSGKEIAAAFGNRTSDESSVFKLVARTRAAVRESLREVGAAGAASVRAGKVIARDRRGYRVGVGCL